jgi:hypothetical protein
VEEGEEAEPVGEDCAESESESKSEVARRRRGMEGEEGAGREEEVGEWGRSSSADEPPVLRRDEAAARASFEGMPSG